MGMNVGGGKKGPSADINITPLIDVVLVLLIIFMVLVPSTLKRLTATLPRRDQSRMDQGNSDQIVLKIGPEGQLTLNDQPVEPAALKQRIAQRLAADAHKVVFFDIDDDARYGAVVRFLDLARGAGARALAIVAREGKP
jgi:biopolymer transport protein ExbD